MAGAETALIVEVPEAEALVGHWRSTCDPVAARGVPAHITTLFPFTPPGELSDSMLHRLRSLCASIEPFEYRLTAIDQLPDIVWLRPSPDEAFRSLTRSIWTSFPVYPPYSGRFTDPQPHLTVAVLAGSEQPDFVRELTAEVRAGLPVRCVAAELSVFESDADGVWSRRLRLPSGATP